MYLIVNLMDTKRPFSLAKEFGPADLEIRSVIAISIARGGLLKDGWVKTSAAVA